MYHSSESFASLSTPAIVLGTTSSGLLQILTISTWVGAVTLGSHLNTAVRAPGIRIYGLPYSNLQLGKASLLWLASVGTGRMLTSPLGLRQIEQESREQIHGLKDKDKQHLTMCPFYHRDQESWTNN